MRGSLRDIACRCSVSRAKRSAARSRHRSPRASRSKRIFRRSRSRPKMPSKGCRRSSRSGRRSLQTSDAGDENHPHPNPPPEGEGTFVQPAFPLRGKVGMGVGLNSQRLIAVTGASRGIGAAIAIELARRGFRVACLTRKGSGPESPDAAALESSFVNHACDVNDEASVRDALKAVATDGVLHGLVNNAGIHLDAPSHEMDTATYERVMQTNATAVFTACREAYPYLTKANGATVI